MSYSIASIPGVSIKVLVAGEETTAAFIELIQRGANLWPDAPPEIKEIADLVTNGEIMQEYSHQRGSPKTKS